LKIKCAIFDLDGTIAQTNELIFETFNYISKKYTGKTFTPQEIANEFFGPPEEGGIKKLLELYGNDKTKIEELVKVATQEFYSYYEANHHKAKEYKGIRNLLLFLKYAGLKLAIFTGKGRITTSITLRKLDLEKFFDIVVTGDDVKQHKPSGEGIKKILEILNLSPDEAILIGDATSDVKAGREANVKVISALWDSLTKEKVLEMKPDIIVHSIDELKEVLNDLIFKNEENK
jgi:pyrophosphatase PpaX